MYSNRKSAIGPTASPSSSDTPTMATVTVADGRSQIASARPRTAATTGPARAAPRAPRRATAPQERLPRRCQIWAHSASAKRCPCTSTNSDVTRTAPGSS